MGLVTRIGAGLAVLCLAGGCSGGDAGPAPVQPIAFSHKVHAGDHGFPCLYCHMHAAESPVAGVPPVKTCMGCHEVIATDRPDVEKLARHWEEKRPIEWVKVNDLPDFVRFTHVRHVRGGVECTECHGPVSAMTVVRREASLSMGWCLECHIDRGADIDCAVCHH
jgi:hypothetical protein